MILGVLIGVLGTCTAEFLILLISFINNTVQGEEKDDNYKSK